LLQPRARGESDAWVSQTDRIDQRDQLEELGRACGESRRPAIERGDGESLHRIRDIGREYHDVDRVDLGGQWGS